MSHIGEEGYLAKVEFLFLLKFELAHGYPPQHLRPLDDIPVNEP